MLPITSSSPLLLLNSLVGREPECAAVERLLATHRLVTLTGPAGIGKTRLGIAVAAALHSKKAVDIHFVALHALQDPQYIFVTIAQAIDIRTPDDRSVKEHLLDYLYNKQMLLLLDGFENVIGAAPSLLDLLSASPDLRLLVTSREVLQIYGEQLFCVRPLALPQLDERLSVTDLAQVDALALFCQRAQTVNPNFALTEENAAAVVQLCQRLDGVPLAIELAADHMSALSMQQINADLSDSLCLLTNKSRTALSHFKSYQESINWSYDLLTDPEKTLFCQLSELVGSFSLVDVKVKASLMRDGLVQHAIVDQLSSLVAKSMVQAEAYGSVMVYRLLEPYRRFALIKRREAQESQPTNHRDRTPATQLAADNPNFFHSTDESVEGGALPIVLESVTLPLLRIFALGSVKVYRGEDAVTSADWKYAKSRELLYYLLCHGTCTKEEIALVLWPDASPRQVWNSLRVTVHHLRRALGDANWILCESGQYQFNTRPGYWFDVVAFESHLKEAKRHLGAQRSVPRETARWLDPDPQWLAPAIHRLEEAASLYHGDFLTGLTGEWYLIRQQELRRRYLEALIDLGDLLFVTGRYRQAAKVYQQIIDKDNYLEVAHRGLMRSYLHQGERVRALRHYQLVVDLMDCELGAPPAPETTSLFERIRQGDEI